jgi:CheY-like chemotaxis protein/CRP-like cAMP-binding protein
MSSYHTSPRATVLHHLRVLYVEDCADDREAFKLLFEQNGAEVTTAATVREALDAFDQARPEIIVSDIGLPDDDGYSLIRAIRGRAPENGGQTPAIAVTGWVREQDRASALEAGFKEHLPKPVTFQDLVNAIARSVPHPGETPVPRRGAGAHRAAGRSNALLDFASEIAPGLLEGRAIRTEVTPEQTLGHAGEPPRYVLFPDTSVVSLMCVADSGKTVEICSIGCDGFVGLAGVLHAPAAVHWTRALVAGTARRVATSDILAAMDANADLRHALLRHVHDQIAEMSCVAACTRAHSVDHQLARWLLTIRERAASEDLVLTHEAIADRVGTRRSSVSLALEAFQRGGLVELSRSRVRIVDAAGLERAACECYRTLRGEYTVDA